MADGMTGRALTAAALAAAMAWASGGVAMAEPPSETGATRSTAGYAFAFLGSTDAFIPFDVFAPPGTDPFGSAEIFVRGYECFAQNPVEASVDGLTSATANGEMALECHFHVGPDDPPPPPEVPLIVQGTAHVALTWTGHGAVERITVAGRYSSCVGHLRIRHAVVTGDVRVVIPGLDVEQSAVPLDDDDNSIRHEEAICRPEPAARR